MISINAVPWRWCHKLHMNAQLLAKYDRLVPRYTSYPTAPHFPPAIGPSGIAAGLPPCRPTRALSLYLHMPYCEQLCWYCGCHTKAAQRYEPVADYLDR